MSRITIMRQRSHYPRPTYGELKAVLPVMVDKRLARFLSKIGPIGPRGCREWQGGTNKAGYGLVQGCVDYQGYSFLAHRVVWALAHGVEPGDLVIRHSCDNRPCCSEGHLLSGTHLDNTNDMIARGRARFGLGRRPVDEVGRAEAIELRFGPSRLSISEIAHRLRRHRATVQRWLAWHVACKEAAALEYETMQPAALARYLEWRGRRVT
jgi:hypothetical protein